MQMTRTRERSIAHGVLLGISAMVLVGGSVAVSQTLTTAPLLTVQAARYTIAVPIVLAFAKSFGVTILRPRGAEWAWLAGVAGMGLVLFNVAVIRGVAHAEPAVIAVAVACVPILLGNLGPLLEGDSPGRRLLLGAVVVTLGSVLVEGVGRTDLVGTVWALIALASEAAFTLLAMPVLSRQGAWGVSVHSVWIAAVMLIVMSPLAEGPGAVTRLTLKNWEAIIFLALMVTALTFVCWYSAVSILGSGRAGLFAGVSPISAALAGAVTNGHIPKPLVWVGMMVVILGLIFGQWSPGKRVKAEPEVIPVDSL